MQTKLTETFVAKIYARCQVLAELVQQMQSMYNDEATIDYQRSHIETIIGAGLWYIPNTELWTGKISVTAVKSFHPDYGTRQPKLTKDHQYPRKAAAQALLQQDWSKQSDPGAELSALYVKSYGRFNYVTPKENRQLMPFQKTEVFTSPSEAYKQAGIDLIEIDSDQLQKIKSRNAEVIEAILSNDHLSDEIRIVTNSES